MASVAGILEHAIFLLQEKGIPFELKILGEENGFPKQRIMVRFEDRFLYIVRNSQRVSYYLAEKGEKKHVISKEEFMTILKTL